jgi:hypothetical protein
MTSRDPIVINVLSFTTLYPNAIQPVHGDASASTRTMPASPDARHGRVSKCSTRVFPVTPKGIGNSMATTLLYRATRDLVARLVRERRINVIDAHMFYPNGVAAVRAARVAVEPRRSARRVRHG